VKDAVSGFPVCPGSAEALVRCGGKIKYILIDIGSHYSHYYYSAACTVLHKYRNKWLNCSTPRMQRTV